MVVSTAVMSTPVITTASPRFLLTGRGAWTATGAGPAVGVALTGKRIASGASPAAAAESRPRRRRHGLWEWSRPAGGPASALPRLVTAVGDPSSDQAICDRIIGDSSDVGVLSLTD